MESLRSIMEIQEIKFMANIDTYDIMYHTCIMFKMITNRPNRNTQKTSDSGKTGQPPVKE